MAKKQTSKKESKKEPSQTNHVVLGLVLVLVSLILFGGAIGGAGVGGMLLWRGAYLVLGAGALMIPVGLLTAGVLIIRKRKIAATSREWIGGSLGILCLLGLLSFIENSYGGFVGTIVKFPFITLFDKAFGALIIAVTSLVSLIVFFDRTPNLFPHFVALWQKIKALFSKKPKLDLPVVGEYEEDPGREEKVETKPQEKVRATIPTTDSQEEEFNIPMPKRKPSALYIPPPLSLLE